ncbi:MAG TPA: carboxypeptidase-like regulatory domain-containing protein [Candidatus Thermoplasmatota archaeon]
MRLLALLSAMLMLLAGCTGGDDVANPQGSEVLVDETRGSVVGEVLDEEFRAIPNATVAVASASLVTQTNELGEFEIGPLDPGDYDVSAYALGYGALARRVSVVAGQRADVTFALPILASGTAFYESFPYVGFEACQWFFEGAIAHCTLPYTQAYGTLRDNGVNLSQYGLPPDLQENKDRYNFTVGADHTGIVSELVWQAQSAGAAWQTLVIACGWYSALWDECVPPGETHTGMRYHFEVGQSPIRLQWTMDDEQLAYREQSPWVMSRANVYGSDQIAVGVAFEQRIEMFNTVFYGDDPPEGFTAGPPDQ